MKDEIVDKIRKIRHEIDKECNESIEIYFEKLLELQKKHKTRLICRKPKYIDPESIIK